MNTDFEIGQVVYVNGVKSVTVMPTLTGWVFNVGPGIGKSTALTRKQIEEQVKVNE